MWGDVMLKKILVIFMIAVMLFLNSICFATDYNIDNENENTDTGIMPLSTIDKSEIDENENMILDYTFHSESAIFNGSVSIPASIRRAHNSWCLFVLTNGNLMLFASDRADYNCYYFAHYSSSQYGTGFFYGVSDVSKSGFLSSGAYYYNYDVSTQEWSDKTSFFTMPRSSKYILPSSFLYMSNAQVFFSTGGVYYSGSSSPQYSDLKKLEYNEVHSCVFYGKSPKLITLSDTTYKVALGTCCGDYTYDGNDFVASVTSTTCKSLFIYIYDMDKSTDVYKYYFSYSDAIKEYITWEDGTGYVLELPFDKAFLPDFFENGHHYSFAFSINCVHTVKPPNASYTYQYYDTASFSADLTSYGSGASIEGDKNDDMQQAVTDAINKNNQAIVDASNKQIEAIEKQHETSKSIWETIKEILSYLNPFSENFFAYKLVELIFDGIKSLFIPEDRFFGDFFDNLYEWFKEKLGFLFYPFELIIEILERIADINFSNPIFNIPNIQEPFTNKTIISATTFNLNDLLSNSIFKNVHNIYLICVDAFIAFSLVNLAKRKFEEVTSK